MKRKRRLIFRWIFLQFSEIVIILEHRNLKDWNFKNSTSRKRTKCFHSKSFSKQLNVAAQQRKPQVKKTLEIEKEKVKCCLPGLLTFGYLNFCHMEPMTLSQSDTTRALFSSWEILFQKMSPLCLHRLLSIHSMLINLLLHKFFFFIKSAQLWWPHVLQTDWARGGKIQKYAPSNQAMLSHSHSLTHTHVHARMQALTHTLFHNHRSLHWTLTRSLSLSPSISF